jgi:hypothetical protein
MTNTYTRVLVCAGALTLGFAQMAQAQAQAQQPSPSQSAQQQQSPQQQQQQPPAAAAPNETVVSADVTDQEVEQFAKSYEDVARIQKDTEQQLQGVQDSTGVAKVKQQANQKMAEAVQGHGMKVERFNLIARSLNQDATLKQRIQQKIQELRQPA